MTAALTEAHQEDEWLEASMGVVLRFQTVLQGSALDQVAVDFDEADALASAEVQAGSKPLHGTHTVAVNMEVRYAAYVSKKQAASARTSAVNASPFSGLCVAASSNAAPQDSGSKD